MKSVFIHQTNICPNCGHLAIEPVSMLFSIRRFSCKVCDNIWQATQLVGFGEPLHEKKWLIESAHEPTEAEMTFLSQNVLKRFPTLFYVNKSDGNNVLSIVAKMESKGGVILLDSKELLRKLNLHYSDSYSYYRISEKWLSETLIKRLAQPEKSK